MAVGDCSVTERRRWRPPYRTGKTVHVHAKHNTHWGNVPDMVSYPGTLASLNKHNWKVSTKVCGRTRYRTSDFSVRRKTECTRPGQATSMQANGYVTVRALKEVSDQHAHRHRLISFPGNMLMYRLNRMKCLFVAYLPSFCLRDVILFLNSNATCTFEMPPSSPM